VGTEVTKDEGGYGGDNAGGQDGSLDGCVLANLHIVSPLGILVLIVMLAFESAAAAVI
jgi:hypothetical protein